MFGKFSKKSHDTQCATLLKKMPDPLGAPWTGTVIIAVFLIVCKQYGIIRQQCGLRRGGFAPALSDEEVITIEICGEYFKLECDKDMFAYFHAHCSHFFSEFTDRYLFVRPAADLWQVKTLIQKRLAAVSGEINDPVQSIDTVLLSACVITGAGRDRRFHGEC